MSPYQSIDIPINKVNQINKMKYTPQKAIKPAQKNQKTYLTKHRHRNQSKINNYIISTTNQYCPLHYLDPANT